MKIAARLGDTCHKIGIVADSHGRSDKIEKAVRYLEQLECKTIYHLGDICDSSLKETGNKCIHLMTEHHISAIKGNNDHLILTNFNHESPELELKHYHWLKSLPMVIEYEDVVFAHNSPLVEELGLSCMTRGLTRGDILQILNQIANKVLFRGHSHTPELIYNNNKGQLETKAIDLYQKVKLSDITPCIVTCGALTRDYGLVLDPVEFSIRSVNFDEMLL